MTVGVPTFWGSRLAEARLARGLYKKSLGDLIGVTGTQISRYEDDEDKPQADNLATLAEKLNFPVEFFSKPVWGEQLSPFFWRSQAAESKYAREMTEQRAPWICEIFSFLENDLSFPMLDLPDLELPHDVRLLTPDLVENSAFKLREHWGLKDRPIPDVTLALENAGIPVIHLEIPSDKQDGFCFRSQRLGRVFVGLNISRISAARARYDAGHELGHAVLHKNVLPHEARDPSLNKLIEQQAHRFAGAFLFPQTAFISEVRAPTLDYFCGLKKRWGMSIAAMVYRAFNLGLIDEHEKTNLFQNMGRRGWRGVLREPFDGENDMPLEKPRMLRRGIEAVIESGVFGRASFLAAHPYPISEIEQIAALPSGYFSTEKVLSLPVLHRPKGLRTVDLESGTIVEFPGRRKPSA